MALPLQIVQDRWLTGFFYFDVLNLNVNNPTSFRRKEFIRAFEGISNKKPVFIYSKVPVEAIDCIHCLEDLGFRIIDTNIIFSKPINRDKNMRSISDIRFARVEDKDGVGEIARNNFKYSRFHLDPAIEDRVSNDIKAQWATNYFKGDRGDQMVVSEKDGQIRGFLQLLYAEKDLVIDLIAVDARFRRLGIAGDMIDFAQSAIKGFQRIMVGTQVANTPSIRLYENMNFRAADSEYIFHFHSH